MRAVVRLILLLGLAAVLHAAEPALTIVAPDRTVTLTAAEFAALPHVECTVMDGHSGKTRQFSGVAVRDLLARIDAPLGPQLRGAALQLAVVAYAQDGYSVVYTLADFDEAFSTRTIILADSENGQPLPATAAPFQLVAPGDKRPARWTRMVTKIEIVRVGVPSTSPEHAKNN
jgi:hypothetical protein